MKQDLFAIELILRQRGMQSGLHGALVRALEGFWVIQIGQTPPFAPAINPFGSSPKWHIIQPPPAYYDQERQYSAWLINPERFMQDGHFQAERDLQNRLTGRRGVSWYGRLTPQHFVKHVVGPETE